MDDSPLGSKNKVAILQDALSTSPAASQGETPKMDDIQRFKAEMREKERRERGEDVDSSSPSNTAAVGGLDDIQRFKLMMREKEGKQQIDGSSGTSSPTGLPLVTNDQEAINTAFSKMSTAEVETTSSSSRKSRFARFFDEPAISGGPTSAAMSAQQGMIPPHHQTPGVLDMPPPPPQTQFPQGPPMMMMHPNGHPQGSPMVMGFRPDKTSGPMPMMPMPPPGSHFPPGAAFPVPGGLPSGGPPSNPEEAAQFQRVMSMLARSAPRPPPLSGGGSPQDSVGPSQSPPSVPNPGAGPKNFAQMVSGPMPGLPPQQHSQQQQQHQRPPMHFPGGVMPNGNAPPQSIYGLPPRRTPDMAYGRPMGGPQAPAMTLAAMIQNSINAKKGIVSGPGDNMMGPPPDGNGRFYFC